VQKHTLKIQCSSEASDPESQDDSKICTVHNMTQDLHTTQYGRRRPTLPCLQGMSAHAYMLGRIDMQSSQIKKDGVVCIIP